MAESFNDKLAANKTKAKTQGDAKEAARLGRLDKIAVDTARLEGASPENWFLSVLTRILAREKAREDERAPDNG